MTNALDNISFTDCAPIFVVGSGRSGTTLLQLMLNTHPDIAICGEIHYVDQISEIRKLVPSIEKPEHFETFFSLVKRTRNIRYLPKAETLLDAVKQRLSGEKYRTYEQFYRCLIEEYAKAQGARRCGEKTPSNIKYLNQIVEIFPNAKIIHIVRDPRAVVASRVKMPWTTDDVVINTLKWKFEIMYCDQFPKNSESYIELRYEDLVSAPEHQLKRICAFIGEEFDSKMLEFYKTSQKYIKKEPWKEGTYRPINTGAVKRWKQQLSEAQIFIIQKILGTLIAKFGYEPLRISVRAKLFSPVVFFLELFKYLRYKFREAYSRKRTKNVMFWGEGRSLYKMFFKSILGLKN